MLNASRDAAGAAGMAEEIQQWKLNVEMFARLSDSFMFQQIYSQQNISILLGPNNLVPYQNCQYSFRGEKISVCTTMYAW